MRIRSGKGRGITSNDEEDKDKSKVQLPQSFLGKIVSLFFVSVIIYIIFLYAKHF
jgi:hypothetical protein